MQQTVNNSADQAVLERILAFKTDVENPSKLKTNQTISVDEAVWLVEAALNYTHCISLETDMYQNCEIIIDSVQIDFETIENSVSYYNTIKAYSFFNNYLIEYSENINIAWKKYDVADIDFRKGKMVCRFVLFAKNLTKAQIGPQAQLNRDWRTGAGNCDAGTCDGLIETGSAQEVLTECLNDKTNTVNPGYFLTNITSGFVFFPGYSHFGSDTLLYEVHVPEYFPCIYSEQMYELYDNAKILRSRYTPPAGWAVSHCVYQICHGTLAPDDIWYWTVFNIYKGKKNYSNSN